MEINARSKKLYGIGKQKSWIPPTSVLFFSSLSVICLGLTFYLYLKNSKDQWAILGGAIAFALLAAVSYISYRRSGFKT